ncbi:MAG: FAD-dependent monooxygenase [Cytophagales bacterium]
MANKYDIGIIGGGLAGLCLSIRLSNAGFKTALFEKKSYPFHRVCGEYVSMEALPYLKSLGFNPFDHGAVRITKLLVSGTSEISLKSNLDMGGFGLSRYVFDAELAKISRHSGTQIFENSLIQHIEKKEANWLIKSNDNRQFEVDQLIGAQGKRSNIDSRLRRKFLNKRSPYVGIKYHIKYNQDEDLIALHNFRNGYCGISRVENDKYCLCYLVAASELKAHGSIKSLEQNVLSENPHLKDIFNNAEFLYEKPLAINEITFSKKEINENGILMCGDAAGMIAPLCGNGMAMAIHSSKLLAESIILGQGQNNYKKNWEMNFSKRLWIGRAIQGTFGNKSLTNMTLSFFKAMPYLRDRLIRKTHGEEF